MRARFQPNSADTKRAPGLTARIAFIGLALSLAAIAVAEEHAEPSPLNVVQSGITREEANEMSAGCRDCHTSSDASTMHRNPAVIIGCAHCHGGDPNVRAEGLEPGCDEYEKAKFQAHVQPQNKEYWKTSRNPEGSYAKLNAEPVEFVRFINPGDLRAAPEACGGCHAKIVDANTKNLMTTSAMLWGGASYNNGILPYKRYILWQIMHWLVGIARVNSCLRGCPSSSFGIVGSAV